MLWDYVLRIKNYFFCITSLLWEVRSLGHRVGILLKLSRWMAQCSPKSFPSLYHHQQEFAKWAALTIVTLSILIKKKNLCQFNRWVWIPFIKVECYIAIYLDHLLDFVNFWDVIAIFCCSDVCVCVRERERERGRERLSGKKKFFLIWPHFDIYMFPVVKKTGDKISGIIKSQIQRKPNIFNQRA